MALERLDKILSGTGRWSRREVKDLVKAGRVTPDGAVVARAGDKFDREAVELRVDGGPTRNQWLMQFQSDILDSRVQVPREEELSGIGAAYAAGIGAGVYRAQELFGRTQRTQFTPKMSSKEREEKYRGWQDAVAMVLREKQPG